MSDPTKLKNFVDRAVSPAFLLLDRQPNYCECAKIASRPLLKGKMPLLHRLTNGVDYLDNANLQLEHQHIIFQQSRDNIGFQGGKLHQQIFSEDIDSKPYNYQSECLDGEIMREAILTVGHPAPYSFFGFNCQAYVETIKNTYYRILGRQT